MKHSSETEVPKTVSGSFYSEILINLLFMLDWLVYLLLSSHARPSPIQEHYGLTKNALDAIRILDAYPSIFHAPRPTIPSKESGDRRKTLVLDLDETLVHCSVTEAFANPDLEFTLGPTFYSCQFRPQLGFFLIDLVKEFEFIIFTAATKDYADIVLDQLADRIEDHLEYYDDSVPLFSHRLYRSDCSPYELMDTTVYVKDLALLGRHLSQTIIIDNSPIAFSFNIANGLPIKSYYGGSDDQLTNLIPILHQISNSSDVRLDLDRLFGMRALIGSFIY